MPDTTPTLPADELRAAAKKLRSLSLAVGDPDHPGLPWHTDQCGDKSRGECPCIVAQGHTATTSGLSTSLNYIADAEHPDIAAFIATLHPGVGLALARWLDAEAGCLSGPDTVSPHALAAARLVLGTTDQQPTTADRRARWEAAAHAAGREVDRNALAVYMAVADAEQAELRAEFERRTLMLQASRDQAAVLSAELTRRAPLLGEYAAEIVRLRGLLWANYGATPRRMADEAQQPETEACTCAAAGAAFAPAGHYTDCPQADEAQPAADQPDEGLCGKTIGIGFPGNPYRPCARPAGHTEAYCRDATEQHHFLAAADQPDTETEAGRLPCPLAVLTRQHRPHVWKQQPGMTSVVCPGSTPAP